MNNIPKFSFNSSNDSAQETFLLVDLSSDIVKKRLFVEEAHSQWIRDFFKTGGIDHYETEAHADFSITRFTYMDIVCLLTINNLSESVWISTSSQADTVLGGLKNVLQTRFK